MPPQSSTLFRSIPAPARLCVPLPPRRGRQKCRPLGSILAAGEPLTEIRSETSWAALAPVAGTILGTTQVMLLDGSLVDAVEFEPIDRVTEEPTPATTTHQRHLIRPGDLGPWIDRLCEFGICSSRTGSPDLIGQLYQSLSRPIDTVLCAVVDTDPNLPLNVSVANAWPSELGAGLDLLAKITGASRLWVAADPKTPTQWLSLIDQLILADGIRLAPVRSDYPQAHPTLLLHTLLDRRLRPDRLPVEQGVLLLDAATAVAVGRCVLFEQPMLDVPIALRDHVKRKTHLLRAHCGTPISDICRSLDIPTEHIILRTGDFLRDQIVPPNAVIGPGELTIHVTAPETELNPDPCVRCAWCIEACPTRVHPAGVLEAAQRANLPLAQQFGIDGCIECGICTFVCPSRLPLLGAIRKLKTSSLKPA